MAFTTINKSGDYFNTKLYTGNGSAGHAITGVGFQSDLSWIKNRAADWHIWTDAVRGVTKLIYSNATNAQDTQSTYMQSFNSDGFTLGTNGDVNDSGNNYASWNWLGANSTAANTAGDLNSTVSANTTAGFSIVTYSGTGNFGESIGHGLGVAPSMIIARRLNGVEDWAVYHQTLGASKYIILNTTGAEQSSTSRWGGVAPTNSVFTVGNHASVNANGGTHIAYCFAEKQGYSKFGSYVGNGNADGPFVYTGFKPAFVLTKNISGSNNWTMCDNKRNTFNPTDKVLNPNVSSAEATNNPQDFVSNGLKNRATESNTNSSGSTYIYMAFAAAPLVGTNNIPANAR